TAFASPAAATAVDPAPVEPAAPRDPFAPAPDDGVPADPDREDLPEMGFPAAERRRRGVALLPAVGAAVAVVLLALIGWLGWQLREQAQADQAREESLEAARDAARVLFSYSHESLEDDFQAGLDVATGEFREEYERTTREVVQPVAEQYDAVVEAEVVEASIVSAEPDRAVALVFLNQTATNTRIEGPRIDQSRVRMVLREVDGEWRVAEVTAL
ncbi:MAG TPA: hypothetical protein VNU26_02485, partial [Mycobacteriales bacterium]|nr:hypothetical protein [Mycobacteriales bacterium]